MKNLAHLLPVLDTPGFVRVETAPPPLQLVASNEFPVASTELPFQEATENISDRFQEGYDTGYAIGVSQGRTQAMAEYAGKDVAMEAYVAKARAEWTTSQAQRISEGLGKALKIIENEIAACVERALVQIVHEKLRNKALDEFCMRIRELCRMGEAGIITIHAPPDLAATLSTMLKGYPLLQFESSEDAQVWVRSGATLIEARLDPWAKSLTEEV